LAADGLELSYAELVERARRLGAALRDSGIGRGGRVGILASRSRIAV
jgi:acyl-CoA synthetase (AMP-forming)/AMP-acid ligase II